MVTVTLTDGPTAGNREDRVMKRTLIGLLSAGFALLTTGALAATKVAGSGGCCPPCPFCH